MSRLKFRSFHIFLTTCSLLSTAVYAQNGIQWVDLLTTDKICAASWTWDETIPASFETVTKTCEKRSLTVLDMDAPPSRSVAPGVSEVLIGEGTANIETRDLQEARRRAVELVVAEYVKQNLDKNIYKEPTITNPSYLDSNYPYSWQITGNQKVPDDAILPPKGIAKEGWSCSNGLVGITGRGPLQPSDCGKIKIEVEVYGQYRPISYTLPTKQIQEKVDSSCQESEYKYIPPKTVIGVSDVFMSLADVSSETYQSIQGNSLPSAVKSGFKCPHGIQFPEPRSQAFHAMDWLRAQNKPLDGRNESIAATVRYLKALALEKSAALNVDQLRYIVQLHKDFPELAFGGQETVDTAVETSAEDLIVNRKKWQDLEKKLSGTQSVSADMGARLLVNLSNEKVNYQDFTLIVGVSAEQNNLLVESARRYLTKKFRINVESGTIIVEAIPYMQASTTTTTTQSESAYNDVLQDLLNDLSFIRSKNATAEDVYQYVKSLVPGAQSPLDSAAAELLNRVGTELTFKANSSPENYFPVSFRLTRGTNDFLLKLSMSSRSGFTELEFFTTRDIRVERYGSGKTYRSPDSTEYNALLDEVILITTRSQESASKAGPEESMPHYRALLDYLNALRRESK